MPTISLLEKMSRKPVSNKSLASFGFKEGCPSGAALIRRGSVKAKEYAQHFILVPDFIFRYAFVPAISVVDAFRSKDRRGDRQCKGSPRAFLFSEMGCMLLVFLCLLVSSQMIQARRLASAKEEEMEKQLKILNKPYVKSFKDAYGNTFDCIDIYKQPAFDHPLLKNHTIKMPTISLLEKMSRKPLSNKTLATFGFKEECPSGTVLIRRTTIEDLIRAEKLAPHYISMPEMIPDEHRAVLTMRDIQVYGAVAKMDVFRLSNISTNQYSLAQVMLTKGERGPRDYYNTIQFGWHIIPSKNLDANPHFFIGWTSDGFQKTGCLNMLCPGFVQTSNAATPGMVIPAGTEAIKLQTFRNPEDGSWILAFEDNSYDIIGYWPKEIFNNMADCSLVQMGGYVLSPPNEPSPPMGSGKLPSPSIGQAAEFREVALLKGNADRFSPQLVNPVFDYDPDLTAYYKSGYSEDHGNSDYEFQYGGPGGWKI